MRSVDFQKVERLELTQWSMKGYMKFQKTCQGSNLVDEARLEFILIIILFDRFGKKRGIYKRHPTGSIAISRHVVRTLVCLAGRRLRNSSLPYDLYQLINWQWRYLFWLSSLVVHTAYLSSCTTTQVAVPPANYVLPPPLWMMMEIISWKGVQASKMNQQRDYTDTGVEK